MTHESPRTRERTTDKRILLGRASMADLYERGIGMGNMSKTYSLAGLRLAWIAGPSALRR
ncbi:MULTISPECIES: hypothetical protein [Paraburkholderia]|uniref:Aminotransferase n=1 Tax=Paraburkholderia strydomiana TaxID=1245417 RepID=A0ABW9C8W5_9BURK